MREIFFRFKDGCYQKIDLDAIAKVELIGKGDIFKLFINGQEMYQYNLLVDECPGKIVDKLMEEINKKEV